MLIISCLSLLQRYKIYPYIYRASRNESWRRHRTNFSNIACMYFIVVLPVILH